MSLRRWIPVVAAFAVLGSGALRADQISYTRTVSFNSDLNDDKIMTFPTFDNEGGTLILTDVRVDLSHRAGVVLRADNDDPFKTTTVNGRMIRTWNISGPDLFTLGDRTLATESVFLDKDNGDGEEFDDSPPDGTDFGLLFFDEEVASAHPDRSLYDTDGQGSVDFSADVLLMANDLQFIDRPDVWQLEVQRPFLDVTATVTYTFVPIPLPAGAYLAALGLATVAGLRRRRRQSA